MSYHTIEELSSSILDFQTNFVRVVFRKKTSLVDPIMEMSHRIDLDYIWGSARLDATFDEDDEVERLHHSKASDVWAFGMVLYVCV